MWFKRAKLTVDVSISCFVLLLTGTNDWSENNEQGKMAEKETKPLETEEQAIVRRREKGEVTKPVKKRPKSEGYELFTKEGYVIGLVSVSLAK